jgi:predicted small metal-binding protein
MKTIKCSDVGGDTCMFEATGETAEDVKMKLGEHAKVAHADMMAKSTPESMAEWDKMYADLWEKTPEA